MMQPGTSQSENSDDRLSDSARRGRARQRHLARKARREQKRSFTLPAGLPSTSRLDVGGLSSKLGVLSDVGREVFRRVSLRDLGGRLPLLVVLLVALIGVFSVISLSSSQSVLPRVTVAGIHVGGMSEEDAAAVLQEAWSEREIVLRDGERVWRISPTELGFQIDARASAHLAAQYGRDPGGMGAILKATLSGIDLLPVVESDYNQVRDTLLRYAKEIDVPPENATLQLQGLVVTHIAAQAGRRLNVNGLVLALAADPVGTVMRGEITLPMTPVAPLVTDATPLVDFAQSLLERPLVLEAYDPVSDQTYPFVAQPDNWGQWLDTRLVYYENGPRLYLSVAREPILEYLQEQAATLPPPLTLDLEDGVRAVQEAVADGTLSTWVTVRYLPTVHTVVRGETAHSISRTVGIPFYMIEQANEGRDLSVLYVGDQINLPSRDAMLPLRPVRNKRIVVDLSDQYMWAYENGQVVYEWPVSTGISSAPTSAGVFQILNHDEFAYGSSFTLCDADTCGQWVMHWFMGIYESVPGLMNGFHGAVELPNGRYLGGGQVGRPFTYGCIMALEDNAIQLYSWAEDGVVVEIRQ